MHRARVFPRKRAPGLPVEFPFGRRGGQMQFTASKLAKAALAANLDSVPLGGPRRDFTILPMKLLSKDAAPSQRKNGLAIGLGWFSIGLGLAELIAPRAISRLIGVPNRPLVFALLGIRELASGLGILKKREPAEWLWTRVAGDVIDLSLLGVALASNDAKTRRVEAAAAAVLGMTVLDLVSARQQSAIGGEVGTIHFQKTITIQRSPETVYNFWRNFENLPRFMHNLESVTTTGLTHSHWVAKGPAGTTVEWEAEILEDVPNRLISWRSVEGSDVDNAGAVRFDEAPGGGTMVRVDISYRPPAGRVGAAVARMFGKAPEQEVQGDLHRFKQVIETGSISAEIVSAGMSTGDEPGTGFSGGTPTL